MTSDLHNKYEQITTSYILSVLELSYPKPEKEWNVNCTTVICTLMVRISMFYCDRKYCFHFKKVLENLFNHWIAGMIIPHYFE